MTNHWDYQDQGHKYLCNGVEKPSVTKLVSYAVGDIYKGIPPQILQRKANYGTHIHEVIQNYILGFNQKVVDDQLLKESINTLAEFIMVTDGIKFTEVEKMVTYEDRFGGRFDLMDSNGYIYDIKTTSKLHKTNLEWQLGLYYLANGKMKRKGYCIWLPKGKEGKMVEIKPKTKTECLDLLERYETDSTIQ